MTIASVMVSSPRRPLLPVALVLCGVLVPAGCSGEDGAELSAAAEQGHRIALDSGCSSCHGTEGAGGVGPSLIGLHGSMVDLVGGGTIVADEEYLRRSITAPEADLVEGYTIEMPANDLSAEEVDAVVSYIQELK